MTTPLKTLLKRKGSHHFLQVRHAFLIAPNDSSEILEGFELILCESGIFSIMDYHFFFIPAGAQIFPVLYLSAKLSILETRVPKENISQLLIIV